jgi:hypothetical protein
MTEATKERDTSNPDEVDPRKGSKTIDIRDMYKFEPEDLAVDISTTCYSNLAYIQVAPRDVIIDFLGLPGVKRDKKMVVSGTRVFMSHAAAQKLVESLSALLENSYNDSSSGKPGIP